MKYSRLGKTGLKIPQIIFGTSALGNLYRTHTYNTKLEIVSECFKNVQHPVFDSAGKYGAGLALEMLGKCLFQLNINPEDIIISNKLGWMRTELKTSEPTFEQGVWFGLKHDAVQKISYNGIIECFDQGNELLGETYKPQLLSVHDPDEYINQGKNPEEKETLFADILEAHRALADLKKQGKARAIGIGSKDWTIINKVIDRVELDWVMFANSLTIMNHPPELLALIEKLYERGVTIINSAVFHGGFLTGSDYYDYRLITQESDGPKFQWRTTFYALCEKYKVAPSVACVNFGMTPPGVTAISLNTSNPNRVKENVESVLAKVPKRFYAEMVNKGLISKEYPYLDL
ncbi:aldo/keto reductase [candidate division KSB1 bacterium]|nr:aldo/keto reductase [candidate division KSB1 bacterium]